MLDYRNNGNMCPVSFYPRNAWKVEIPQIGKVRVCLNTELWFVETLEIVENF